MKLTQNQYYGLKSDLPSFLREGSVFLCSDTKEMYIYIEGDVPFKLVEGEKEVITRDELNEAIAGIPGGSGGSGTLIIVVSNYSLLPNPTTVSGKFYYVNESQGSKWLPGNLGGSYYPKGIYYSNGISWSFVESPYQSSQIEVDSGVNNDKFITPLTLNNYSKWNTKYDSSNPSGFENTSQLNSRDVSNRNRSNHTGTQLASTVSNFLSESRLAVVDDFILNSVVDKAPSQNSVFDALSVKTENSVGSLNGFAITDNGNGTVNITSGEALLRSSNSGSAPILKYLIPSVANLTLTDESNNYVLISYNSGSPIILVTTDSSTITTTTNSLIYLIAKVGNVLNYVYTGEQNVDSNGKLRRRFLNTESFARASGSIVSGINRNLTLTQGLFYSGLSPYSTPSFDTSTSGTFTLVYNNGSAWNRSPGQSQINNTQYNSAGTLNLLSNNKFRVDYIYLLINNPSKLYVVLGDTEYLNIASARLSSSPLMLPAELQRLGVLVGRLIIEKDSTSINEIASSFDVKFTSSSVSNHNDLAGLNLGDYKHLTALEKNKFDFISITQPVNLDQVESDTAVNNSKITNATHTGDVTGDSILTISSGVVTNAKLSNIATKTYKGRTSSLTGVVEDVSVASLKSDLSLNLVDNTSDINKPISTATQNSLNSKKTDLMNTARLLGRNTAGTGVIEEITLGTNLSFSGNVLNATSSGGGSGGITRSVNNVLVNTTAGAVALTDYVFFITGTVTLTLPTAIANTNMYTIKCISGIATVACNGVEKIDGTSTIQIAVEDSVDLISNNTEWKVV